jgi:hypothetical protein
VSARRVNDVCKQKEISERKCARSENWKRSMGKLERKKKLEKCTSSMTLIFDLTYDITSSEL